MSTPTASTQQRRARTILLLIAGIPISMMLAATALWWAVDSGHVDVLGSVGTANHGALITPPRSLSGTRFQHEGGGRDVVAGPASQVAIYGGSAR